MKIEFEHLGSIETGSIELNDFTVFCGKNNSGKTYAMYVIYGLLEKEFDVRFSFLKKEVEKLKEHGTASLNVHEIISEYREEMIMHIQQHLKKYFPRLFCVSDDEFVKTVVRLYVDDNGLEENAINKSDLRMLSLGKSKEKSFTMEKEAGSELILLTLQNTEIPNGLLLDFISKGLISVVFTSLSKNSFLLPAERAGLNLFFKELSSTRNLLLQHAKKDSVDPMALLKDIMTSRYADPIQDYIQYLNKVGSLRKEKGFYGGYAKDIQKRVLSGKYDIDAQGNVSFTPYKTNNKKLPLHFSSSTVKTLFGLVFYLEHLAQEGDCLMIDEPELNLHPDNQRQVARVLAQLVNSGLKVIVSTHSDYFVRELNNLIMLKKDFSGKAGLQKKYGYNDNELLDSSKVSAYLFDDKKISIMKMDVDEGIIATTFDEVINNLNKSSNEIFYTMQDAKEIND